MIGAHDNEWLQTPIEVLTDLFKRVGLKTNTEKMEAMPCTTSSIRGHMSGEAFKRNRDGSESYREHQSRRIECPDLAKGSLAHHIRSRHGMTLRSTYGAMRAAPSSYWVSFPKTLQQKQCPVEWCSGTAPSRDKLCILEEGLKPLQNVNCAGCT
jgi:hypothetical protein